MVMKNKLQKHHKSKKFFLARNFALSFMGLFTFSLAIIIPTYISSLNQSSLSMDNVAQKSEQKTDLETPEVESVEETLSY